jgi:hypothetical protein
MSAASARQFSLVEFRQKEKRKKLQTAYASVLDYLENWVPSVRNSRIFDHAEIRRIARFCSLHPDDVRTQLRRCGYEKIVPLSRDVS